MLQSNYDAKGSSSSSTAVVGSGAATVSTDVHGVLNEFANNTSLNCIPRIINARTMAARVFWSMVCIFAFLMFLWTSGNLLNQYYSYPKKVNVEIVQRPVTFPSVTVCNTDHLDMYVVERLEQFFTDNASASGNSSRASGEPWVEEFIQKYTKFADHSVVFLNLQPDRQPGKQLNYALFEVSSRLAMAASVGPELSSKAGIKIKDYIINCRFMGESCDIEKSFVKVFDPFYFNCFTFQPHTIIESGTTRLSGVEYGLSLLLFSGIAGRLANSTTDEIVPGLQLADPAVASGKGARVVIHSPGTMPHPTADGYDIPAGFSVTIGVKARENVRIPPPHGNCTDEATNGPFRYSLIYCQNQCIQKEIMDLCRCVDYRTPITDSMNNTGLPFCLQLPDKLSNCTMEEESNRIPPTALCKNTGKEFNERLKCRKGVYENMTIRHPDAIERCRCFPPCSDVMYDASYSLSMLPENSKEQAAFYALVDGFLEKLDASKKKKLPDRHNGSNNYLDKVKSLVSRVNVHIADSNIIKTTESPDYDLIRLVSDIGGQLGLWVGISVITLVEVLQLCADVVRIVMAYGRRLNYGTNRKVRQDRHGSPRHNQSTENQQRNSFHHHHQQQSQPQQPQQYTPSPRVQCQQPQPQQHPSPNPYAHQHQLLIQQHQQSQQPTPPVRAHVYYHNCNRLRRSYSPMEQTYEIDKMTTV